MWHISLFQREHIIFFGLVFDDVFVAARAVVFIHHRPVPIVMLLGNKTGCLGRCELQLDQVTTLIRFFFQPIVICVLNHLTIHVIRNLLRAVSDPIQIIGEAALDNVVGCKGLSQLSYVNICCIVKALLFGVFAFVAKLPVWWENSGYWWMLLNLLTLLGRHRQLVVYSLRWFVVVLVHNARGLLQMLPLDRHQSILLIFLNIRSFRHRLILRPPGRPVISIFHS